MSDKINAFSPFIGISSFVSISISRFGSSIIHIQIIYFSRRRPDTLRLWISPTRPHIVLQWISRPRRIPPVISNGISVSAAISIGSVSATRWQISVPKVAIAVPIPEFAIPVPPILSIIVFVVIPTGEISRWSTVFVIIIVLVVIVWSPSGWRSSPRWNPVAHNRSTSRHGDRCYGGRRGSRGSLVKSIISVPVLLGVGAVDLRYEVADEGFLVKRRKIGAQEIVASAEQAMMVDLEMTGRTDNVRIIPYFCLYRVLEYSRAPPRNAVKIKSLKLRNAE